MGRGKNKELKIGKVGLKQILGRIFRPRDVNAEDAKPFLVVKDGTVKVPLTDVVAVIQQSPQSCNYDIVSRVGIFGLKPDDIEIVRAYIHRFGSDVANPLPIEDHPSRTLLLDENMPQPAMVPLSCIFGWATHVAAEGLAGRDTPDADILLFGCRYHFAALVSRDTDFLPMYERLHDAGEDELPEGRIPVLVFVDGTVSTQSLSDMFSKHRSQLKRFLQERPHLALRLHPESGLKPLF